jgi:hypothetical protein
MTTDRDRGLALSSGRVNLIERRFRSRAAPTPTRSEIIARAKRLQIARPPTTVQNTAPPLRCCLSRLTTTGLRPSLGVTGGSVLGAAGDGPRARRASGGKSRPRSFAPAPLRAFATAQIP